MERKGYIMHLKLYKGEGTPHTLTEKTTRYSQYNKRLKGLQELRDIAWLNSMEYHWDPIMRGVHEEYLDIINSMLKECINE